jgi:hypothetical protein
VWLEVHDSKRRAVLRPPEQQHLPKTATCKEQPGPSCAMARISRFRVECSFLGFKLAVQPDGPEINIYLSKI